MRLDADLTLFDLPDLRTQDFSAHNDESVALWKAFSDRTHERIPVRFNCNPRILMLNPQYNARGLTYEEYMRDPEVMGQAILEFRYWTRFLLPGDHERGLPNQWSVYIDFENHYDAAWFGCPVHYREGQVPDTTPILTNDNKRMLFDRGIPDPFEGEWAERCLHFLDVFRKKQERGWTFMGVPVVVENGAPFLGCDGLFTVAVSLRGATELCLDLLIDPDYARELLEYVYAAITSRMKAWRDRFGIPVPIEGFGSADDAIEMLSPEQYRQFVLPLHKRFFDEFGTPANRGIHLCGGVQRHFKTIHEELGVVNFDTGFPVDFARFRKDLGPDVLISGGPRVPLFLESTPEPLLAEAERILRSGVLFGGKFILQEGNNLPPCARLELCAALYDLGKRLGRRSLWDAPALS
jgi:uroporphyrinogen-III decarboxylase